MTIFNGERLETELFQLDRERMAAGWYSDVYFRNIAGILEKLSQEGYTFKGQNIGDIEVELQIFPRRQPFCIAGGIDEALSILKTATGYEDEAGNFVNTSSELEVKACHDGEKIFYSGNPHNVEPVLKIRGRYRDFSILETPILGSLTEASRIATNVYKVMVAARGKDVLFFPARFTHYKLQAMHGYAYSLGVNAYNNEYDTNTGRFISTDEQGAWWGGKGGGTISHSYVASFLGDTAESMIQFCRLMPLDVNRIALVDFDNNCVETTLKVLKTMFNKYLSLLKAGEKEEAKRYKLFGVRPDNSSNLRDESVQPLGKKELDNGVNARLIFNLRKAIDNAYKNWDLQPGDISRAKNYCTDVKIIATGGFAPEKIDRFESSQVPVDIYGVGSWLLSNCGAEDTKNDYTADVVRVKIDGEWKEMAKVGRSPANNPNLEKIDLSKIK
ncbi:nicotinate phosphoribosyltransferase [Halanaerobium hydrogeniformans]|uniref:Quinolinate phosphoribosyl transferase n=1 Tax=Halanaerobium hydrogeniformans TaxID=656519 RepID=E4RL42_HALHG|nr:nicotinate phosphoribosyltransferase [Halanaerobium hydrogeniformans]ADQ14806.1 Quinolinate phosphoribosyl transferase [Halanaerobium hydrogeniformans]